MDFLNRYWTIENKKAAHKAAFCPITVLYRTSLDDELVEVRGIEPLSENIQRNSPTCVADDLFIRSCPRPPTGLERPLAQNFLVRRR